jgi:ABC-2 type transport system permease protein
VLCTLVIAYTSLRALPFSLPQNDIKGANFLRGMFSMVLPMLLGIVHFMAYNNLPVIIILFLLSIIAVWLMADALKNKSWEQLTVAEFE